MYSALSRFDPGTFGNESPKPQNILRSIIANDETHELKESKIIHKFVFSPKKVKPTQDNRYFWARFS
jgi:hypothetical protein